MSERIRLKYQTAGTLSIRWAHERKDYVAGDCFVCACRETSDPSEFDLHDADPSTAWSRPMTLEEAREFIAGHRHMLGSMINRCLGVTLLDEKYATICFAAAIDIGRN